MKISEIAKRPVVALLSMRPIRSFLKKAGSRLPVDSLESILYRSILRTKFSSLYLSKQITKHEDVWDFSIATVGSDK